MNCLLNDDFDCEECSLKDDCPCEKVFAWMMLASEDDKLKVVLNDA